MRQTRRRWLQSAGAVLASVAVAGCNGGDDEESDDPTETDEPATEGQETSETDEDSENGEETDSADGDEDTDESESDEETAQAQFDAVEIGVVSEWNAIRTRLRDPVILGHAGEYAAGVGVVDDIFQRFEAASGDHNAHETLEATSTESYEGFEGALGDLREALDSEDLDGAHAAMKTADSHLREAQAALTSESVVKQLSMLVMGAHVEDAALLLDIEEYDDAEHEFSKIGDKFEAKHYDMVAEADAEAADQFVAATDRAAENVESDTEAASAAAHEAFKAATQGIHALADDPIAGAAHMAALQARGWDGTALARLGGPSRSYAHAAALNDYRAHARDVVWLYESGNTETAAAFVQRALERFETARAHDALEEANSDAYESFEGGLETLGEAIENGDDEGVRDAVAAVETGVRDGIGALASGAMPAALEAGYTKTRIENARERYLLGDGQRAADIAQDVFADFEADAAGFHETLEETDADLYEAFEHEHLEALIEAFQAGDDEAVRTHVQGIRETLLSFETAVGARAVTSGVESGYITARLRDAVVLDHLDSTERARTVATGAFQHFESGAGGFHEAIEDADEETYESFESSVTALQDSLGSGETTEALTTTTQRSTDAAYAVVTAGGSGGADSASVGSDIFAHFEGAAVHDMLEAADSESYETFEAALDAYVETLESGGDLQAAASQYAEASLRAQFAVAGAAEEAPVDARGGGDEDTETELQGGPNVVEGVPDDADHVVDMTAVAFEPAEITVSASDTVAWKFVGGEPHSVSASEEKIPDDAEYWASGDFDSEDAAREGWENGIGAVQEGQSYVHTFETPGKHGYVCIPHEAAGMVGTVVVEE